MRVRVLLRLLVAGGLLAVSPALVAAQTTTSSTPPGENYRVEISGGLWRPAPHGTVASEQFGIAGSQIDFVSDLDFTTINFGDGRLVLRPGRKHKLRVQYTPVSYSTEATLDRDIVFNGILYPVNVPVNSTFDWKVWRFGYEFDFIYTDRGYLGLLLEGRYTQMGASLTSPVSAESTKARAPLPAIGAVARVYPLPILSITAEVSGLKIPEIDEKYEANYADIDVYGTLSVTRNFGVQAGWRRMTTFLKIEDDQGDIKFQGFWLGGTIRF